MISNYDKEKYAQDFPDVGTFNWVVVKFIMPDNVSYNGREVIGVLLHDKKFMVNGVLFDENEFEVIDRNPLDRRKRVTYSKKEKKKKRKEELEEIMSFVAWWERNVIRGGSYYYKYDHNQEFQEYSLKGICKEYIKEKESINSLVRN